MSVSTEVQRTLVKSPPELWSELSNPKALARHLADLGEIRITFVEPETKVEWEAEGASGVVHLKQSGWGTKVTLSVTREAPTDGHASESETIGELEPVVVPEPAAEAESAAEAKPASEAGPVDETGGVEQGKQISTPPSDLPKASDMVGTGIDICDHPIAEPEPRPGFFTRLFRRRKTRGHAILEKQTEPKAAAELEPEIEIVALAAPEPIYPKRPVELAVDLAGELESVEAQMAEDTTELLTGVLDRLGAAHHRPFSRG